MPLYPVPFRVQFRAVVISPVTVVLATVVTAGNDDDGNGDGDDISLLLFLFVLLVSPAVNPA